MRENGTGRIFKFTKWVGAALIFTVFISSCSQKIAMVKSIHNQPAFVQSGNGQIHSVSCPNHKIAVIQPALIQAPIAPISNSNKSLAITKTARHSFIKKAAASIAMTKMVRNIESKTNIISSQRVTEHGAEIPFYLKLAIIFAIVAIILGLVSNQFIFGFLAALCLIAAFVFLLLWVLAQ